MNLTISNLEFEGKKNPQLYLRRKQIKALKAKEAELRKNCNILEKNSEALELPLKKVSSLPPYHPDNAKISELWNLKFNMQYSFINGSYSEYRKNKIEYAKKAVENLDIVKYVKEPIQFKSPVPIFSKIGMNMTKNIILDKLCFATPEEKQLVEYYKEEVKKKAKYKAMGLRY